MGDSLKGSEDRLVDGDDANGGNSEEDGGSYLLGHGGPGLVTAAGRLHTSSSARHCPFDNTEHAQSSIIGGRGPNALSFSSLSFSCPLLSDGDGG